MTEEKKAPEAEQKTEDKKKKPSIWQTIRGYIFLLLFFFSIKLFLFDPMKVPTSSLTPNVVVGDWILVNKFSYGYSNHSIYFTPNIIEDRVFSSQPQRGDIISFAGPGPKHDDADTNYVKRLVGLPGDRIQMIGGKLHINGQPCLYEEIEDYEYYGDNDRMDSRFNGKKVKRYIEKFPIGDPRPHEIVKVSGRWGNGSFLTDDSDMPLAVSRDDTVEFIVKEGHYFFMGDNRDLSGDCRNPDRMAQVPFKNLIGRVDRLFISTTARWWNPLEWFTKMKYGRIFKKVI